MYCSFIIPAFNEEKLIAETLKGLQASALEILKAGLTYEIIVCDNNCTDRTVEIAKAYGARIAKESINQIARARNAGAAIASGEWLVFVDADTLVPPELIREWVDRTRVENLIGGGSLLVLDQGGWIGTLLCGFWNRLGCVICQWAAGAFLYCRRSAFEEVGGFNSNLYASEEIDLSIRLKKLARQTNQRFRILKSAPVISSARKLRLYTARDMVRLGLRFMANPMRALKSPESCFIWYDGRR